MLEKLPVEIVLFICKYLDPFDMLHMSHVNIKLYNMMNDEYLWKQLCTAAFHCHAETFRSSPRLHYFSVHKAVQHVIHSKQISKLKDKQPDRAGSNDSLLSDPLLENECKLFESCHEALEYYIENKDFIKAEHLLEHGLSLYHMDDEGCTLLHKFICKTPKDMEIIKWLLENNADVNTPDFISWTPLHYATSSLDPEIIQCLILYNGNLSAMDYRGDTPFDLALTLTDNNSILHLLRNPEH